MIIKPLHTKIINPPKDDLLKVLDGAIEDISESSILAVSSKVVSIWQGRTVKISDYPDKDELTKKEAELFLPRDFVPGGWIMHTIKNGLFIPTAGIDLSNGHDYYILWPEDPMKAAEEIRSHLKSRFNLRNFGVLITDSHSVPGHRGTVGISLGFAGFAPIKDYRGQKDLFGREFMMEIANLADSLSSAAVLVMGEGAEGVPAALISDTPFVEFGSKIKDSQKPFSSFSVPLDEDLYGPFIKFAPWKKGK